MATRPSPAPTTVTAYPDGPLIIRGDFRITDADGETIPTGRMAALCRCGRSAAKPLCDNSHLNARRRKACAVAADE
jgi:CDGSH-type Zn-finger protein